MKTKKCKECNKDRQLFYFKMHSKSKDGYRKTCNICASIAPKITQNENGVLTYRGQVKKALEAGTMEEDDFSVFMLRSLGIKTK